MAVLLISNTKANVCSTLTTSNLDVVSASVSTWAVKKSQEKKLELAEMGFLDACVEAQSWI